MNKYLLCLSLVALLASCGGNKPEASSEELSSKEASSQAESSAEQSSQTSEKHEFGYEVDTKKYTFPTQYGWSYQGELPEVTDKIIAFCPVQTGYQNVYSWDDNGPIFGSWPGKAMSAKSTYDANWYEIEVPATQMNIIFNNPSQTKDMVMTHAGYWWFWNSDKDMHDTAPEAAWIDKAKFVDANTISVVANVNFETLSLMEGGVEILKVESPKANAIKFYMGSHGVDLNKTYAVKATLTGGYQKEMDIDTNYFFTDPSFDQNYAYTGNDLGANYTKEKTTFKVWSPFSSKIDLKLYDNGTPTSVSILDGSDATRSVIEMTKGEHGVFEATVQGDLDGVYYTYEVTNSKFKAVEIVDPYAKSAGVNGKRGMVIDFSRTNPDGWDEMTPHQIDRKALTVWETHIADLTSAPNWGGTAANSKKYAGFHEAHTHYTEGAVDVKTGFDHVKELGVNAVQIIPFFDQDNDEVNTAFNWGYNPLNYNVPEGCYSSNPYDGHVRVRELKELIKDYHDAGMNIIMDVVYNHVASANKSNFDVLLPGYFYRYTSTGALANGSGCGNETASDHYMMRKFIVDSTSFWAKEYKLGGFRFDLMALHDLDTMAEVAEKGKAINPSLTVYGEPWTGGTSTLASNRAASQANGNKYVGYGQFNDGMRDALIKGGMHSYSETGWANGTGEMTSELADIVAGIKGFTHSAGTIDDPDKTVNYVACHDNFTIYDRNYVLLPRDTDAAYTINKKRANLANSVVFTSQGTSFMLAGDEFLRTKNDSGTRETVHGKSHNSYDKSYETNMLDWSLKVKNIDTFQTYKKLIALKQTVDGLHLAKTDATNLIITTPNNQTIVYEIKDTANNKTYKVAHRNGANASTEATVDFAGYSVYLDTLGVSNLALSSATTLEKYQTIIGVK